MPRAGGLREKLAWVLIQQGRVLVTRNQGRDLFYFPGGMRQPGESDAQALVREIDEELQVTIDEATMAHFVTVQARGDASTAEMRMTCYTAGHRGKLVPDHEIAELAWLAYADRDHVSPPDQLVFDALHAAGQLA